MPIEWHGNPRWNDWNCQELSALSWRVLEVKGTGTADRMAVSMSIESRQDGKAVLTRVRDHGPGVPEPLDSTAGSGLGLAIANQAVLAQGGRVKAFNAEGAGLVQIHLPVKATGF